MNIFFRHVLFVHHLHFLSFLLSLLLSQFCGLLAPVPRVEVVGGMHFGGGALAGRRPSQQGLSQAPQTVHPPGAQFFLAGYLRTFVCFRASSSKWKDKRILLSSANQKKKNYRNKFKWLTARKGFLGREMVAERPWMGRPGLCNDHHLFPHPDLCFS